MSHDLYASWATAELANIFNVSPAVCFSSPDEVGQFSIFANRESGRIWPIPDGRLSIDIANKRYEIAIELKRTNEGLHGILTALGQSQAYLHKGYSGSIIVIPEQYDSFSSPGEYVRNVINHVQPELPVGVFAYNAPDSTKPSPFHERLNCFRPIGMGLGGWVAAGNFLQSERSNTQWAHLREGSSEPDAFFKYLQIAKKLTIGGDIVPNVDLPPPLLAACVRLMPDRDPIKYLSNSVEDHFHDRVWRIFWFEYVFNSENSILFDHQGEYSAHDVYSGLLRNDDTGEYKKFWSARADSIKNKLVRRLNAGEINEERAWELFAENVRNRAHSYREDIDSGLEHLGFIEADGKPSELGYKFVDACERTGNVNSGLPNMILGSAILKNGNLGAFLHYIYKVSEEAFKANPIKFTEWQERRRSRRLSFVRDSYLDFIRDKLANELKVMNTAAVRGGVQRRPFQGELAILRKFNFVGDFRLGVGLEINWPLIQEYLEFTP